METGTRDNVPLGLAARLLMRAGSSTVLRTLRLQAITWMLMIGVGASFTAHADQWMTSATGTTTSNGQSMSLVFGNGVTATYTQGATTNNPPLCAGSTYAAPGAILGGTNVPGFIEPDPAAGSVSVSQCVGNGAPGVLRTLPHTFSFNKPVIGPVLHMQNLDGSVYDVSATTISGGAVTYTQLAKNNALEVAALSAATTRFNNTPQGANNFGCMLNNGGNPTGGCGSFRLTGGPVQTWTTANRLLIVLNTGDGWFWSVSFQTARLTKAFGAASIVAGQTTPLTFTIDNTNATNGTNASTAIALGPLDFTDVLPSGMTIANGTTSGTCAGATFQDASSGALGAGDTGVRVSGFTVPANATCTLTVNVTAASPGTYTNTAANMSSGIGNLVLAPNASLTVIEAPRVTISKVSLGGTGAFPFTGSNGIAAQTLTTTVAGTPVSGAAQTLATVGAVTTITESAPPTGYVLTDITCTNVPAGGTATPNLATRTVSLDGAATAAGANITCTFTNTLTQPALSITKTSNGPWIVGQTGAAYTLSVSNTGNLATSGTITVRDQLPTGIGIRPASGFTPATGWTCTYSDELAQNNSIVTPNTGMAITCTSTNAIAAGGTVALTLPVLVTSTSPASVINRASVGGGGDPFNGGVAPIPGPMCANAHCSTTSTAITASPPAPASCPSGAAVNLFSPAPFQATLNADNTTQTLTATLLPTAGTYTIGTGTAGRFVVDMNWRWNSGIPQPSNASTLTLRVNGTDYATLTTQAGFAGFGTLVALNGASLFGGTATVETNRISTESLWVTLPASVTTVASVEMVYASGSVSDDFIFNGPALYGCPAPTDLSITKASITSQVTTGDGIAYSIVATNNGPSAANGAVISDNWTALPGLDCSAGPVTCVASGAAGTQCPAPASVTPAALQAGLAIPVFPTGGVVTFTLQCAVTATGL